MTKKKKYYAAVLLTLLLGVGTLSSTSLAATSDDIDDEAPAFANPAQAQHAANLAEQAALSDDSVKESLQDVEDAQDALDEALESKDPDAVAAAREALAKAEDAYTEELADITGVIESDISAMRDSGMGFGVIAHELGVHPGLLGLGHTKGKQKHNAGKFAEPTISGVDKQELAEATARNMKSGWSKGHGVGVQAGVHDPGTGLFDGATKGGRGKGNDKDRGSHGVSGAGGLGSGSGHGASGVGGGHGNSGGNKGGTAGSSGGPGNSGGHSNAGGQGKGGNNGSNGNSGGHGNSGGNKK